MKSNTTEPRHACKSTAERGAVRPRPWLAAGIALAGVATIIGSGGGGGNGALVAPSTGYVGVDVGDIDGDGWTDFAAAGTRTVPGMPPAWFVDVFLQDAMNPGSYLPPRRFPQPSQPFLLVLADLNGDQRLDVVTSGGLDYDVIMVMYQDPLTAAEFGPPASYASIRAPVGIAASDLNQDGRPDVLVAGRSLVAYHAQDDQGAFGVAQVIGAAAYSAAAADLDGDLRQDVVSVKPPEDLSGTLFYFLQDASLPGQFSPPGAVALGDVIFTVAAVDINGDGGPDLAGVGYYSPDQIHLRGRLALRYRVAADPLTYGDRIRYETRTGDYASEFGFGDVNGDGRTDIVVGNRTADDNPNNVEIWLQAAVNGAFESAGYYDLPRDQAASTPEVYALRVADLNGDLALDIMVSTGEIFALFQLPGMPGSYGQPVRLAGPD